MKIYLLQTELNIEATPIPLCIVMSSELINLFLFPDGNRKRHAADQYAALCSLLQHLPDIFQRLPDIFQHLSDIFQRVKNQTSSISIQLPLGSVRTLRFL